MTTRVLKSCILCSYDSSRPPQNEKDDEISSTNEELFEIVCKYLDVTVTFSFDEDSLSMCTKCTQLGSEILNLHQQLEEIRNDISKRVEQIEQGVVNATEDLPVKGLSFIDEFRQKVKKKIQRKQNHTLGQNPPYQHIVDVKPALMHHTIEITSNIIKIQPEDTDDEGGFLTDEIEIYPFNDGDESEDFSSEFKVVRNDNAEDYSNDEEPSTNFRKKLRPRRSLRNQSKASKVTEKKSKKALEKRIVKSEPESELEMNEGNDSDNSDSDYNSREAQRNSDVDDPEINFSHSEEESDPEDDDWRSESECKRKSPRGSTTTTAKKRGRPAGAKTVKFSKSDAEKYNIVFTPDGHILYENIEIIKMETKSGLHFKCGECNREFDATNLRNRESPYYKVKFHIRAAHLGQYKCKICWQVTACSKSLSRHNQRFHGIGVKPPEGPRTHCEVCQKPFKTAGKDFLFSHMWTHKSEEEKAAAIASGAKPPLTYAEKVDAMKQRNPGTFPCSQCDKSFIWKSLLKKHETRVHLPEDQKVKNFACHICSKKFVSQGDLTAHKKFVCEKDKLARLFFCSFCDKNFALKDDCQKHERKHTKEKPFQCSQCLKFFSQEKTLRQHGKYCKGPENATGKFYQGVEMIYEATDDGFVLKCGLCDYTVENIKAKQARYDTYRKIHLHIQGRHLGAYKCQVCGKQMADPKGLKNHMQTHNKEPPKHNCEVCGKPFKSNKNKRFLLSHLWTHMSEEERQERIAAGETPPMSYAERMEMLKSNEDNLFQCDQCGKTFAWQCQLKKHKRVHSEDTKQHQCSECGKFYATPDSLNSHVKHVHKKDLVHKWHYCSFENCTKKFSHKFAWRKHERSHRRDTLKAFQCKVCSKAFSLEKKFQLHVKQCHANSSQPEGTDESSSSHPPEEQDSSGGVVSNVSMPLGMPGSSHPSIGNVLHVPQQYRQVIPQSHNSSLASSTGLPSGHHFMVPPGMPGSNRFYEADGNMFQNFFQ